MRHADRVRGANIAQMINVLQAMILTDGPRMVLTPTYHVYHMYVPFQGATLVPLNVSADTYVEGDITLPRIDAVAARDTAGRLWLAVTNTDPKTPATIRAAIPGKSVTSASGQLLTGPAVDSHNSFDHPDKVEPIHYRGRVSNHELSLDLPPRSIAVLQVQ